LIRDSERRDIYT